MKANDFIKKFGIVKASKVVIGYPNEVVYKFYNYDFEKEDGKYDEVCLVDLKRLVESHELVEHAGGLDSAKKQIELKDSEDNCLWCVDLKIAIADVESCMEVASGSN